MKPGHPTAGEFPTTQHPEAGVPTVTALRLTVIEGPDEGKSFLIDPASPQRVLLGSSPACEIRLTDPAISRRHAAIEPIGRRCKVTDLGSTNGTYIDGVGVVEAFIRGEEVIRCGSSALRVDAEGYAEGAPAKPPAVRFGRVLGVSEAMRRLYPLCERLATTRISVLIEGEAGTGKELLAESLHDESGAAGPFVVFDCSAAAPSQVEAELFGHVRGAFSGAATDRPGAFEQANGGTLFIDELGDLDLALQPKLLRAIERGEIKRVGAQQTSRVDVRVLCATRRDLDREVAAGRFREDLLRRVAIARVELPPLRDRKGDISLLARHFGNQVSGRPDALPADVLARFEDYPWPGNVRELYSAVARRVALGDAQLGEDEASGPSSSATPEDGAGFPSVEQMIKDGVPFPIARRRALDAFEKRYVEKILELHGGSVAKASAASGLARRYFQVVKARAKGAAGA